MVNTSEILSVYDALMNKVTYTLAQQYDANRLDNVSFGSVLSNSIASVIQSSVIAVQNQPKIDAEISATTAQSTADTALKTKQGLLIDAQINTEVEKKLLTTRQKTAYDDNLRIKEGELLSNVVGMYGAGGTTLPSGLETTMLNAINAITP